MIFDNLVSNLLLVSQDCIFTGLVGGPVLVGNSFWVVSVEGKVRKTRPMKSEDSQSATSKMGSYLDGLFREIKRVKHTLIEGFDPGSE